jgi:hypothetical protein
VLTLLRNTCCTPIFGASALFSLNFVPALVFVCTCSVAALLRNSCCIPTESGELCKPCDVLVCNSSTVRQLVSHEQLQALLSKHFCHSDVTILHTSAELRAALGVGEFSPLQVVQLIEQMDQAGKLQQQGIQWVQRMLLCLFAMLEATAAGPAVGLGSSSNRPGSAAAAAAAAGGGAVGGGNTAADAAGSWAVQVVQLGRSRVIAKLRKLQILPLQDGRCTSIESGATAADAGASAALGAQQSAAAAAVFFPLQDSVLSSGTPAPQSPRRLPHVLQPAAAAAHDLAGLPGSPTPVKQRLTGVQKHSSSRAASTPATPATPSASVAGGGGCGDGAAGGLRQLLQEAGVSEGWLWPGLSLLSCKLFEGLTDEELQLMETGLTVSCWRALQHRTTYTSKMTSGRHWNMRSAQANPYTLLVVTDLLCVGRLLSCRCLLCVAQPMEILQLSLLPPCTALGQPTQPLSEISLKKSRTILLQRNRFFAFVLSLLRRSIVLTLHVWGCCCTAGAWRACGTAHGRDAAVTAAIAGV